MRCRPATATARETCCTAITRLRQQKRRARCRPTRATRGGRAGEPCVLVVPADGAADAAAASELLAVLGCAGIAVAGDQPGPAQQHLSFGRELRLARGSQPHSYRLAGATAADCVLAAVDGAAGLCQALGLQAAAVVVLGRGPALSSDLDCHPAVAAARVAAQLGLPALASCLATPSAAASMQPALQATAEVLRAVLACLENQGGWPCPANYPRAHFPFAESGRFALGKELPLPRSSATSHGWQQDCWALGDDTAWAGDSRRRSSNSSSSARRVPAEQRALLRGAFADGDLLLALNTPPGWGRAQPRFAAARPGVLWHCWQVEPGTGGGRSSWRADADDLWGRSLPRQGGAGLQAGAFVSQDNTAARFGLAELPPTQQQQLPASFTLKPGTLLSDEATAGDVEAVFAGRCSLVALQTWPPGHPLSLRDELLAAHLEEGSRDGLPAWLLGE